MKIPNTRKRGFTTAIVTPSLPARYDRRRNETVYIVANYRLATNSLAPCHTTGQSLA